MSFSISGLLSGGIVGGLIEGRAEDLQERAAEQSLQGQRESIAESRRQFDLTREDLLPFITGGVEGQNMLLSILRGETDISQDPATQNMLNLAGKQAGRFASARGSLGTGSFMKDLLRGVNDVYQNKVNNLLAVSGRGQNAAGASGQFGAQVAGNIGNRLAQMGDIRAGLNIGRANNLTNALNNLFSLGAAAYGGGM